MKFIVFVKGNKDSEAGVMPSEKLLAEMTKFNEELVKSGILLDLSGLHPTSKGCKVVFDGAKRTVVDGPFAEAKEHVAGYWLVNVKSREEIVEWVKRVPNPTGEMGEIEIRQLFEMEDFANQMSPETRAKNEAIGAQLGKS